MEYEILRLRSSGEFYEKAVEAPEIPIGKPRIGGPIIDLPEDFYHPDDMYFAGMLDLNWLSQFDKNYLLPKTGYLLFFYNLDLETGEDRALVHYYDGPKEKLRRIIREHEEWFWPRGLSRRLYNGLRPFPHRTK